MKGATVNITKDANGRNIYKVKSYGDVPTEKLKALEVYKERAVATLKSIAKVDESKLTKPFRV